MLKTSLPTVLLRGNVLFPNNELKLEFDNEYSRNIISEAEFFHDNKILVSSVMNKLEEVPQEKDLCNIGVVAKIIHKIDLPNGKTRVILKGLQRAFVHEYLNIDNKEEILETIISKVASKAIPSKEEEILVNKLYRELEEYVRDVPYISNSFLSVITNITSLEQLTDLIVPNLSLTFERMIEYLKEFDSSRRLEMILEDIYIEKEKFDIEKNIDLKIKQGIENTQKQYLLREKIQELKKELDDSFSGKDEIDNLRLQVQELQAPQHIKERLNEEIDKYDSNISSLESPIIKNYIEYLLKLPWYNKTIECDNLTEVLNNLNEKQFGMDDVKERIIEFLAVKKVSKNMKSPILCLVGPPGIGKTTLAYNIAKSINRKFAKISLGGVNDPAEIVGHRRTYLGAEPGGIIRELKRSGSSNPVFLIDEIDKMGKDIKGDPANALLEVLDPVQNKHFCDHYIEEEVDLSDVLFIVTANEIEDIPHLLKDRLEIIELSGYSELEKLEVCKRHIIPRICKEYELNVDYINFSDESILDIIKYYTKEAGLRELERLVYKILRKIIRTVVANNIKVSKIKITPDNLEKYLGKRRKEIIYSQEKQSGVVNSIGVTINGGEIFPIEVTFFPGNGNLTLTGTIGQKLRESAQVSLNYIKANYKKFDIPFTFFVENDIHVHIPGEMIKDGSSIGVALTTAFLSAFKKQVVSYETAMTGEITLLGNILPVGNILEKMEGASRAGIKKVFIPKQNEDDIKMLPSDVLEKLEIILVDKYDDIINKIGENNE